MRELFLVCLVVSTGYCSVLASHRIVYRFLERPDVADVTPDMPIEPQDDLRSITRADILANSRKCKIPPRPRAIGLAEREWYSSPLHTCDEQAAYADFPCRSASDSSNKYSEQESLTAR